jgi:hypothetical protein
MVTRHLRSLRRPAGLGSPRLFLGKTDGHTSTVSLKDEKGRPRLVITVTADGKASIDFLDASGKTVRTLAAAREPAGSEQP